MTNTSLKQNKNLKPHKKSLFNSLMASLSDKYFDDTIKIVADSTFHIFCENEIIRELPFFSLCLSLYNCSTKIYEVHTIRKLYMFLIEFWNGNFDEVQLKKYIEEIETDEEKRDEHIYHLLLILDRYLDEEKSPILARLFVAHLKGIINWDELRKFAEVLDRFIPGDYEKLISEKTFRTEKDIETDTLQRLTALGLVIEEQQVQFNKHNLPYFKIDDNSFEMKERNFIRTEFGNKLVEITLKNYPLNQQ